jgi:hypothetical protein
MSTLEVTVGSLNQATVSIEKIAVIAHCIHGLALQMVDDGQSDFDVNKAVSLRELASMTGFLADHALVKCGRKPSFGDVVDWVMPPSYFRYERHEEEV